MANERVTRDIIINYTESNAEVVKDTIKTIDRMIQNRQLNRYWKDQNALINDVTNSYEKYNKTLNKMDATELVKSFNALKALSGIKELDISQLLPNFDKVEGKVKELIKSIDLNEAFGVDAFSSAFKVFDMLKAGGIDLQDFFKRFDLDIDTQNLQKSLRLAEEEIQRVKNKLVEKDMKIDSLISGSGFEKQEAELESLRNKLKEVYESAEMTFNNFLYANNIDPYSQDGLYEYFQKIKDGAWTAEQAISEFKAKETHLLQESYNKSGGLFNLQQVQEFEGKLESVLHRVEEISRQMNDIVENGVMTKAMQNLSVDDTISQSQRDLFANVLKDEEALSSIAGVLKKIIDESVTLQGVNNKTFDEEQFNRLLILFEKIESSLSSMKAVFVDVGDGEEFSPLLKMIDNVQSSVKELSTSVSGIKLDVNMDLGSEVNERINQKVSQSLGRQLEAYKKYYDAIRSSGKLTKEMFNFVEPYDASISELIGVYKGMISRVEQKYGKDTLKNSISGYADYIKEINNATAQFNRATNKKNTENPLGDLFGKNELIEVVSQLGLIADRLSEISSTVSGLGDTFKNVFKEGFNVSASVEEIEKLTNRVKELETELSKVKVSSTSPVETNISSGNSEDLKVIVDTLTKLSNLNSSISLGKIMTEAVKGTKIANEELLNILQTLRLVDKEGKVIAQHITEGTLNSGVELTDKFAIISRNDAIENLDLLIAKEKEAEEQGIILAKTLASVDVGKLHYDIQELAQGQSVHKMKDSSLENFIKETEILCKATDEQILKLYSDAQKLSDLGFKLDLNPSNLRYDEKSGFSFIDLELRKINEDAPETISIIHTLTQSLMGFMGQRNRLNWDDENSFYTQDNLSYLQNMLKIYERLKVVFSEKLDTPTFNNGFIDSYELVLSRLKELEKHFEKLGVSTTPIEDTFQVGTSEASKMEEVATATTDAVQAKKDFAAANEGVQASVDNSKSKLELESELMEEVAKSADKATKAKDKYSKRSKISEDTYTGKSDDYASIANQKLNNSGYTILGGSVSTELENGLVKVSAKIKNTDGIWKTFSAKIDADGNMFEQRFRTVTNGIEKLENELRNFDRESTNSTNKVVKTFTDIDIPKESFDDVIAKFNIIEEKAKNIVKITRSDVQNNDGTYSTSYTARYKDGINEILGESSDPQLLRRTNVLYDAQQAVKESNRAYKELIKTIQNYSEVQKRIAKNEAFDGDLALAQKLRDEITELQKQPILSSTQLEEANKRLVKLRLQVEKIKEQTQQTTQSKVDKALVSQLSAWKSIQGIREKIAKTDEKDTTKLQKLNEEKRGYQKQYLEAEKVLKANEDLYDKESQLAKLELERLETNEKINKLKLNNVDVSSVISNADAKASDFEARKHQSEEYRTNVEKLKQSIDELRTLENSRMPSKLLSENEAQKIKDVIASVEEYIGVIKNMSASEKGSTSISRGKEIGKIEDYMKKNTRMSKEFKAELEELLHMLRTGGDSVNVENVHDQFLKIQDRIRLAKQEGISFFDIFNNKVVYGAAAKLANYYLSFYDFIRYGRNAINVVVELNTQMINLSKVSEQTVAQISKDFSSYAKTAKEVGATISDTISATTNWAKNGYNIPDSQELAKVALIYKNVGDIDIESANESLISTIRGFKLEAEDAMHVIDVFNEVSNNEAISAGGIGEALKRSAASFSAANTSLEQSVALITATNSVLQDEEKTGNMWRTVSARIRGAKTELEEAGLETEGMVESTSKLQGLIKGMTGFDILEEDGKTFKDIFDIVLNIGEEFQNLSDIDQAALLEALAGKQQSNALAAALNNVDILKKSYEEAMNAEGSALEEQEKWAQGLQYSIDRIKASLQELAQDLLKSDFLKGLIESGNTLVNVFDKLVKNIGLLGTLGLGGGAFLGIKNAGREKCYPSSNMPVVI